LSSFFSKDSFYHLPGHRMIGGGSVGAQLKYEIGLSGRLDNISGEVVNR
jgi:hypothetical protein